MSKPTARLGVADDLPILYALDRIARREPTRRLMLKKAAVSESLWVAEGDEGVVGYGIVTHDFFGRTFIDLIYIEEEQRGKGIGPFLIGVLENQARTERIFTSTNQSNRHMQHLLTKSGYAVSGIINDLDHDDPELIYSKSLYLAD